MKEQSIEWGKPGICPYCGVLTDHRWSPHPVSLMLPDHLAGATHQDAIFLHDGDNPVYASTCVSERCGRTAFWVEQTIIDPDEPTGDFEGTPHCKPRTSKRVMLYPEAGNRPPPADGLDQRELDLYKEAAKIATISPRAAAALLRVLLEAFLKRQYGSNDRLINLIEKSEQDDNLPTSIKTGLEAIRIRGNATVHDPYGITSEEQENDLPMLFQAIDDLVDELHAKPKRWNDIITSARPSS